MKTIYRLACVLAAAALAFAAVGCGEDDEPTSGKNNTEEQLNPEGDPEGTVTVNIGNDGNNIMLTENTGIKIQQDNNFIIYNTHRMADIVSMGKAYGLLDVDIVPNAGWSKVVAVLPNYGYLIREYNYGHFTYIRLYVEDYIIDTTGGIIGACVKYQYPFYPDNTLCLDTLSDAFFLKESNNYTCTIGILHYVPFEVSTNASGNVRDTDLEVEYTENEITISLRHWIAETAASWRVTLTDASGIEQSLDIIYENY